MTADDYMEHALMEQRTSPSHAMQSCHSRPCHVCVHVSFASRPRQGDDVAQPHPEVCDEFLHEPYVCHAEAPGGGRSTFAAAGHVA